jgi:hypothetical protein
MCYDLGADEDIVDTATSWLLLLCGVCLPACCRTDYDLGPGLDIQEPSFKLSVPLPKVSLQQCA